MLTGYSDNLVRASEAGALGMGSMGVKVEGCGCWVGWQVVEAE